MTKIVVNRCYGGFSLSEEAFKELGLEWDGYGYEYIEHEKRSDKKLVKVVERLGTEVASGFCANLNVVEIPDDVDWEIHDYDGFETIREKARSW